MKMKFFLGLGLGVLLGGVPMFGGVTVERVSGRTVQAVVRKGDWYEVSVEVLAKGAVGERFSGRVKVELGLGVESGTGAKKGIQFYRSSAELVALEVNRPAVVRFYLPPEIVKRDSVRGEPKYFAVNVSEDGKEQVKGQASVSGAFANAGSVAGFWAKVGAEGAVNDGVLLPQYLTPFYFDENRAMPSWVRREVGK